MQEERSRILEMVAQGKVTPEEGARLIEALSHGTPADQPAPVALSGKFLIVRFYESEDKQGTVRVPLELLNVAERFAPADAEIGVGDARIRIGDVLSAARDGLGIGEIADIKDGDTWVKITIEGPSEPPPMKEEHRDRPEKKKDKKKKDKQKDKEREKEKEHDH